MKRSKLHAIGRVIHRDGIRSIPHALWTHGRRQSKPYRIIIANTIPPSTSAKLQKLAQKFFRNGNKIDNSFQRRYINPHDVAVISPLERPIVYGERKDGDWDTSGRPLSEHPVVGSLRRHYIDAVPLEETDLKRHFEQKQGPGQGWTTSTFDNRVAAIETLYDRIQQEGFRNRRELSNSGRGLVTNEPISPLLDEVTVDVGRDGRLLWRDYGLHRLTIAQIQGIDKIPVFIASVHEQYDGDLL